MGGAAGCDPVRGLRQGNGGLDVIEAAGAKERRKERREGDVGAGGGGRRGEGPERVVGSRVEGERPRKEARGGRGGGEEEVEERGGEVGAAEAGQAGSDQRKELARGVEARQVMAGERGGDEGVDAGWVRLGADGELEVEHGRAGGCGGGRGRGRGCGGGRRRGIDVGERGEGAEEGSAGRGGGAWVRSVAAEEEEGRHGGERAEDYGTGLRGLAGFGALGLKGLFPLLHLSSHTVILLA